MTRADIFLYLLRNLEGVYDEGPEGRDDIDQLQHCLQMGTRAVYYPMPERFCALAVLHDSLRVVAPIFHGETLAIAIADKLTLGEQAMIEHHADWQYDVVHGTNITRRHQDEPWYDDACVFGQLDAESFAPHFRVLPLTFFEPMIRRLLD